MPQKLTPPSRTPSLPYPLTQDSLAQPKQRKARTMSSSWATPVAAAKAKHPTKSLSAASVTDTASSTTAQSVRVIRVRVKGLAGLLVHQSLRAQKVRAVVSMANHNHSNSSSSKHKATSRRIKLSPTLDVKNKTPGSEEADSLASRSLKSRYVAVWEDSEEMMLETKDSVVDLRIALLDAANKTWPIGRATLLLKAGVQDVPVLAMGTGDYCIDPSGDAMIRVEVVQVPTQPKPEKDYSFPVNWDEAGTEQPVQPKLGILRGRSWRFGGNSKKGTTKPTPDEESTPLPPTSKEAKRKNTNGSRAKPVDSDLKHVLLDKPVVEKKEILRDEPVVPVVSNKPELSQPQEDLFKEIVWEQSIEQIWSVPQEEAKKKVAPSKQPRGKLFEKKKKKEVLQTPKRKKEKRSSPWVVVRRNLGKEAAARRKNKGAVVGTPSTKGTSEQEDEVMVEIDDLAPTPEKIEPPAMRVKDLLLKTPGQAVTQATTTAVEIVVKPTETTSRAADPPAPKVKSKPFSPFGFGGNSRKKEKDPPGEVRVAKKSVTIPVETAEDATLETFETPLEGVRLVDESMTTNDVSWGPAGITTDASLTRSLVTEGGSTLEGTIEDTQDDTFEGTQEDTLEGTVETLPTLPTVEDNQRRKRFRLLGLLDMPICGNMNDILDHELGFDESTTFDSLDDSLLTMDRDKHTRSLDDGDTLMSGLEGISLVQQPDDMCTGLCGSFSKLPGNKSQLQRQLSSLLEDPTMAEKRRIWKQRVRKMMSADEKEGKAATAAQAATKTEKKPAATQQKSVFAKAETRDDDGKLEAVPEDASRTTANVANRDEDALPNAPTPLRKTSSGVRRDMFRDPVEVVEPPMLERLATTSPERPIEYFSAVEEKNRGKLGSFWSKAKAHQDSKPEVPRVDESPKSILNFPVTDAIIGAVTCGAHNAKKAVNVQRDDESVPSMLNSLQQTGSLGDLTKTSHEAKIDFERYKKQIEHAQKSMGGKLANTKKNVREMWIFGQSLAERYRSSSLQTVKDENYFADYDMYSFTEETPTEEVIDAAWNGDVAAAKKSNKNKLERLPETTEI